MNVVRFQVSILDKYNNEASARVQCSSVNIQTLLRPIQTHSHCIAEVRSGSISIHQFKFGPIAMSVEQMVQAKMTPNCQ